MTAEELLAYATQTAFVVIWIAVLRQAIRRPRSATIHTAVFFGLATVIISVEWASDLLGSEPPSPVVRVIAALLVAMPYVLLLLADDFAGVPRSVLRGAGLVLAGMLVSLFLAPMPFSDVQSLTIVICLVVILIYSTAHFVRAAQRSSGVSRRRMQAVAMAGALLALFFVFIGLQVAVPSRGGVWSGASNVTMFVSGLAYFAGFAPPQSIRRAWQAPQMQRFFSVSTLAPRDSVVELVGALEENIAPMLGAQHVSIALWDAREQRLASPRYVEVVTPDFNRETTIAYRSFRSQTPLFVEDAARVDPENIAIYRQFEARAIMVAPITIGSQRIGMLMVFDRRPPLFAEDDLEIVQILAHQIALLLRDVRLVDELSAYRAHQEAVRLKDDFLAAAAHELRTPLTALTAQAQLMQRRYLRDPDRPPEAGEIDRLVTETGRMRSVVDDLLDAARDDQVGFLGDLELFDLHTLIADVFVAVPGRKFNFQCEPVTIEGDIERIRQVLVNLRDNALKYSPGGEDIDVDLGLDADYAFLRIRDRGIGIAPDDLPIVFERFRRAPSVRHGSVTGLGLGLYFCKRIVEEHGGEITVKSVLGAGSEFKVRLPLDQRERLPHPGGPHATSPMTTLPQPS